MKKPATSETPCQPHVELQLPLPLLSCLQAVREGFFELCIHVGEQAWHALMEQDRPALCGARWSRDPSRRAGRGGSTASEVTLGGRRIRVRRLRAAQVDGPELALPRRASVAIACAYGTRSLAGGVSALCGARWSREDLPRGAPRTGGADRRQARSRWAVGGFAFAGCAPRRSTGPSWPCRVWAKLRVEGIRTSKERVRRLMREHHLQAPHRVGQAHGPKAHDGTIGWAADRDPLDEHTWRSIVAGVSTRSYGACAGPRAQRVPTAVDLAQCGRRAASWPCANGH